MPCGNVIAYADMQTPSMNICAAWLEFLLPPRGSLDIDYFMDNQ